MNKPVAWMGITANGFQRLSIEKLDENDIPLYTHPVKQLDIQRAFAIFEKEARQDGHWDWKAGIRAIIKEITE